MWMHMNMGHEFEKERQSRQRIQVLELSWTSWLVYDQFNDDKPRVLVVRYYDEGKPYAYQITWEDTNEKIGEASHYKEAVVIAKGAL